MAMLKSGLKSHQMNNDTSIYLHSEDIISKMKKEKDDLEAISWNSDISQDIQRNMTTSYILIGIVTGLVIVVIVLSWLLIRSCTRSCIQKNAE